MIDIFGKGIKITESDENHYRFTVTVNDNGIASDSTLGDGFCIGHSYFCELTEATDGAMNNIVEYELIPLLKE